MLISFRTYLRSFCLLLDPDLKPVPWQIQNQRWTLKKSVNIYEHFKMGPVFHGALIFVPYCKDEQGYHHHIAVSVHVRYQHLLQEPQTTYILQLYKNVFSQKR